MNETEPSSTALMILRSLVLQSRDPVRSPLLPSAWNETNERLLKAIDLDADKWLARARSPAFRRTAYLLERMLFPGLQLHYVLRKRFIEDIARQCIAREEFTQVVNISAGYDSLCYRLHWEFPQVNFFELDHPGTQAVKRRALESMGFSSSLELLPVDLRRATLADTLLSDPAFDRSARTVFIAEGLLMYLDARVITSLFETVNHHSGPGSCFVFSFIEHLQGKGTPSPLIRWWLRKNNEPFVWAISRESLPDFLVEHMLDCDEVVDAETFRDTYLSPANLTALKSAPGELFAVATRP